MAMADLTLQVGSDVFGFLTSQKCLLVVLRCELHSYQHVHRNVLFELQCL